MMNKRIVSLVVAVMLMLGTLASADTWQETMDDGKYEEAIPQIELELGKLDGKSYERDNLVRKIGDCYRLNKEYTKARIEYQKVLDDGIYRKQQVASLLGLAKCAKAEKKFNEEQNLYVRVIEEYIGNSPEVKDAFGKLSIKILGREKIIELANLILDRTPPVIQNAELISAVKNTLEKYK